MDLLTKIESGKYEPTFRVLLDFATALAITRSLIYEDGVRNYSPTLRCVPFQSLPCITLTFGLWQMCQ